MIITEWPAEDRPREKLLQKGAAALSDAELLAIFIRTGIPGKTAVDLARELLNDLGGIRQLLTSSQKEFCKPKGLGTAKYVQLQAILEMSHRHLSEQLPKGNALSSPSDTRRYLISKLRDHLQEVFACLFLDNKHRVIELEEMFYGTVNGASVHPREVVKRALHHNAAAVIFAHNHPSGISEPSHADRHITEQLVEALKLIDVRVLDHIVIGDGELTSFAESGYL